MKSNQPGGPELKPAGKGNIGFGNAAFDQPKKPESSLSQEIHNDGNEMIIKGGSKKEMLDLAEEVCQGLGYKGEGLGSSLMSGAGFTSAGGVEVRLKETGSGAFEVHVNNTALEETDNIKQMKAAIDKAL